MFFRAIVQQWLRQNAQQSVQQMLRDGLASAVGRPPSAEPPPPCNIVVTCALSLESGGLVDLLEDSVTTRCGTWTEYAGSVGGKRLVIADTGVGMENARVVTNELLTTHRPQWLISSGFAGGLVAGVDRNHIVIATEVIDERGRLQALPGSWGASSPSVHLGRLLTVDRLIRLPADKRELAERWQALACDMETAGVLQSCRANSTRAVVIRIISDGVDDQLSAEIEAVVDKKSLAQKFGAVTGAILRRPSSVKEMWDLRERALVASDRLAKFLVEIVAQLP